MTRVRPESGQIRPGDEVAQLAAPKDLRKLDVSARNNDVFAVFQPNSEIRPESGQIWPGPNTTQIRTFRQPEKSAQKGTTNRQVA